MKFYRRQFFCQIFTVNGYLPLNTGCPASFTRCEYLCKMGLLRRPIKIYFRALEFMQVFLAEVVRGEKDLAVAAGKGFFFNFIHISCK